MSFLEVKDLHTSIDGKEILTGLNLSINKGEVHAIMGPNGSGKSTLANAIMGHPSITLTRVTSWSGARASLISQLI
jgi:Fe-S cluster assembly ATP-binding protein